MPSSPNICHLGKGPSWKYYLKPFYLLESKVDYYINLCVYIHIFLLAIFYFVLGINPPPFLCLWCVSLYTGFMNSVYANLLCLIHHSITNTFSSFLIPHFIWLLSKNAYEIVCCFLFIFQAKHLCGIYTPHYICGEMEISKYIMLN
jgi:hypothetical protein